MTSDARSDGQARVLLVCDWFLKYVAGLAGGLRAAGAAPVVITRDHALEFGGDPVELDDHVRELAGPDVPVWKLGGRMRELAAMRAVAQMARRRRRLASDVVHLQESTEDDLRLLAVAGLRRGRYAYTVHDPIVHPGDSMPSAHARVARRLLIRNAGLVFVHGEELRDELRAHVHVKAPIEIVPHGTAPPAVAPIPSRPSILFFGRLSAYKGLDVLLDAMPAIWRESPEARLVIAGSGDLPEHAGLDDARVEVRLGHVPESAVPGLFADATVVALPYVQASQSGVGSLAKSYGRPVVVTTVGSLGELVADGSGLAVPGSDAGALATAIASLLADPARAAEIGAIGARSAAATSGWPSVGEATLQAYERHGLLPRGSMAR